MAKTEIEKLYTKYKTLSRAKQRAKDPEDKEYFKRLADEALREYNEAKGKK